MTLAAARALHQDDELLFPLSKGAFAQYWEDEETPRELRVYYRDKEIAFDDPAFWSFGENADQAVALPRRRRPAMGRL